MQSLACKPLCSVSSEINKKENDSPTQFASNATGISDKKRGIKPETKLYKITFVFCEKEAEIMETKNFYEELFEFFKKDIDNFVEQVNGMFDAAKEFYVRNKKKPIIFWLTLVSLKVLTCAG